MKTEVKLASQMLHVTECCTVCQRKPTRYSVSSPSQSEGLALKAESEPRVESCTAWGAVPLFWDFTLGMGQKRTAPKVTTASSWPSGNHSEAFRWLYGNGEINLQNVPLRSLTVLTEYLQIATSFYCVESPQNPCPPETSECAWHK